jgi:xanthine dehydrogenase FAD-binding subunit
MQEIEFFAAATLDDAYRLLGDTGGRVIAGGTDVIVQMQRGVFPAKTLIDVSRITDLRFIREEGCRIHIGALTTYADVLASPLLREAAPALVQAAATVGAPQTRSRGTVGGNIGNASPAGDLLPPLLALDATVTLASAAGTRALLLNEMLVGPRRTRLAAGEIIHSASFERMPSPAGAVFLKLGNRSGMAISVVNAAVVLALDGLGKITVGRVALGAVAPRAVRCPHAEALLARQSPDAALFEEAARAVQADIAPISDIRGTVAYRRQAAERLVNRALHQALERTGRRLDS